VIEGPPDEIVHVKYIEEARPQETGKRRGKIPAACSPHPLPLDIRAEKC
jgi:hypothetical protein